MYNYIAIEGCIGAGKTSLAQKMAIDFNAELILERFEDNSFLPKFYKDPLHYAFPVEMTFLTDRYQQLKTHLSKRDLFSDMVIADYFIEKCIIFSKNNLQDDEYSLYTKIYDIIATYLPKPDLLLYLYNDADHLLQNIAKRGRSYEQSISADYLNSIQESYLEHLKKNKEISTILLDSKSMDFVTNESDYLKIKELLNHNYPKGVTVIG
ncbi:MAG: deoxynucleoside kinase [Bacteroidales bacterium]|jgi:deoxyadenosine/deoxycytidine kinase|nr:deoxynucleoside kinase [Bacteroidales bacterium]